MCRELKDIIADPSFALGALTMPDSSHSFHSSGSTYVGSTQAECNEESHLKVGIYELCDNIHMCEVDSLCKAQRILK